MEGGGGGKGGGGTTLFCLCGTRDCYIYVGPLCYVYVGPLCYIYVTCSQCTNSNLLLTIMILNQPSGYHNHG